MAIMPKKIDASAMPPRPVIESLAENAEYAALAGRAAELEARACQWEDAIEDLRLKRRELKQQAKLDELADPSVPLPDAFTGQGLADLRQEIASAENQLGVIQSALTVARGRLKDVRERLSYRAAEESRPWRFARLAEMAKLLCHAKHIVGDLDQVRRDLEDAGLDGEAVAMLAFEPLGDVGNDDNALGAWLDNLVGLGVLTGTEPWLRGSGITPAERQAAEKRRAEWAAHYAR